MPTKLGDCQRAIVTGAQSEVLLVCARGLGKT
jgi:hypothetical protein